jgi:hypothetical protein
MSWIKIFPFNLLQKFLLNLFYTVFCVIIFIFFIFFPPGIFLLRIFAVEVVFFKETQGIYSGVGVSDTSF